MLCLSAGLSAGLSHWSVDWLGWGARMGGKTFLPVTEKTKGYGTLTHTHLHSYIRQCVNICALAEGTHRLCSSAWQSYCCWFLKWPLQYFRLFCHCVINKETLRPKTRQLNDGSANLSGLLLHINVSLTDNQMDRRTDRQTDEETDWWMDCPRVERVLAAVLTRLVTANNCWDSQ